MSERLDKLEKIVTDLALSQAKTDEQLNELKESQSKTDEHIRDNSRDIKALKESQAKTDEKLDKLATSQAKTDEKLDKLAMSQAKTDEKLDKLAMSQAKTDEQLNRTEKAHEKLSKEIRNFIGNYGQTVEEYFFHSLEYSMKLGKIKFNSIRKNVKGMITEHEYDIILANSNCVGVIEVKSKLHFEDVATLRKTHIDNFKKNFQEYKDYKHYFALASMVTYPDLIEVCKEEGVFLLTQKGDHIELVNDKVKIF